MAPSSTYEVISVVPVELFKTDEITRLSAGFRGTHGDAGHNDVESRSNSSNDPSAKSPLKFWKRSKEAETIPIRSQWKPESEAGETSGDIGSQFEHFCIYRYDVHELTDPEQARFPLNFEKFRHVKYVPEKSRVLMALRTNATSLCIVVINAFEPRSQDTDQVVADLKAIRKETNQIWKSYHSADCATDELDGVLATIHQILACCSAYDNRIKCSDYAFTFFGAPADSAQLEHAEKFHENGHAINKIAQDEFAFTCDWSTLVLSAPHSRYPALISKVTAMAILTQSLWNKYDKLSRLANSLSRQVWISPKVDERDEALIGKNLDLELHIVPSNPYTVVSSNISQDDLNMLIDLFASAKLDQEGEKIEDSRSTLQHFEQMDYEIGELRSQATIQWLLIILGLLSVADAIFFIDRLRLEGFSLLISILLTASIMVVLSVLITWQRFRIRKRRSSRLRSN